MSHVAHPETLRSRRSGRWTTFSANAPDASPRLHGEDRIRPWFPFELGAPGLWKQLPEPDAGSLVFDVPFGSLDVHVLSADRCIASWACRTLEPASSRDLSIPARDELDRLIEPSLLTVRDGGFLAHVLVEHRDTATSRAFSLCVPLAPAAALQAASAERLAILKQLAADADGRWRMVRVGLRPLEGRAHGVEDLLAEINLTGVPSELLEQIVPVAIDALRIVARSLLAVVHTVLDASVPLLPSLQSRFSNQESNPCCSVPRSLVAASRSS
jgi:hypothetical protein